MELLQYIRLFRKWFWLILLCSVLAGGAAFISSSRQEDLYRARVVLVVGTYYVDPNPSSGAIQVGVDLAQTYVVMARSLTILEAAFQAGNFEVGTGAFPKEITANVVGETSLIQITTTHTDPILAVTWADEIANQLILKSPSNLTPEQQGQIDLANSEIQRLREQLEDARVRLLDIENQLATETDLQAIESLTEQYNTLITQINQASGTIANYQNTISQLQQRTNSLEIWERARLLGQIPNNAVRSTILAVMVGAALAVGVALLIEYLDDSIRTPEQANQIMELPTLAAIPKFGKRRENYRERLITYRNPDSPSAEEYRTLRTNLLYSMNGKKVTYLVSSPGPSEGKTITVANLAVAMAAAGWRVLLIDADLRRPRLHEVFDLDNHIGFSTLLSLDPDESVVEQGSESFYAPEVQECIKDTDVPGLRVITSGHIPLNPAEVLGSASMQRWYEHFMAAPDIEIVLFDTPPILVAADAAVLASVVEAPVVMVIEAGRTKPSGALRAKERLQTLDVKIKGLVLNAVSARDLSYYGGYYYYYYYKSADQGSRSAQDWPCSDDPPPFRDTGTKCSRV